MSISMSSTLADVAFAVCTALDRVGTRAVLTGGSAATYYAPDAYQSDDLDFVIAFSAGEGQQALFDLGYERVGDFYRHPDSPFPLEFPPGPLAVGDDRIESWHTARRDGEVLYVLSPTDSCRDRLAALLFWTDYSGLEQALAVCRATWEDIDLPAIADWCRREGKQREHDLFAKRLADLALRRRRSDR